MNLLVLGINHKSAPVAIRERVAFVPETMEAALTDAQLVEGVDELVILSTCNRTELYVWGEPLAHVLQRLLDWLADHHSLSREELASNSYHLEGESALRHLVEVAAGLDS
ncbi:MAG: glutamyl-tRNA reductase, partial [Oceanisphaera sp.]|nr:glutamyl-tRNA reductase [Oceanisphaera sp.]